MKKRIDKIIMARKEALALLLCVLTVTQAARNPFKGSYQGCDASLMDAPINLVTPFGYRGNEK